MKIGVFIPGRVQSERLPNKLILKLRNTCLWEIACEKLNQLPKEYNKYVLCADKELIKIAKKFKNIKIIKRDPKTCETDGPLNFIFKDLKDVKDTHLMFLNPCLYNLKTSTILDSLKNFEMQGLDYGTSVKKLKNWLFDAAGNSINDINYQRLSTKEVDLIYQAAHCFHIFNKKNFFKDGMMLKEDHGIVNIEEDQCLDVDTKLDFEVAKCLLEK